MIFFFGKIFGFSKKSIVAKTHVWSQMGIRSMIVYFWYVPKGYRKQHFHSLIAILKIDILIELFHNPWNPYYSQYRGDDYKLCPAIQKSVRLRRNHNMKNDFKDKRLSPNENTIIILYLIIKAGR